ncbi:MAG: hypothetical protein ACI8QT_002002 [Halioglobus sp.]|jgi:uncharacterized protein YdiU (UPF0061 family)
MNALKSLQFDNSFRRLHADFYTPVEPQGLSNPRLVSLNQSLATQLGLESQAICAEQAPLMSAFSANSVLPGSQPLAMAYSGHQFGVYNPQLGDGRGLLLGEITKINTAGEPTHWDLHLKGAGMTPYSRMGDGRAVLRSSIREYLGSEAVFGLGIPSTRALCVLTSDTPVYREGEERGATLLRVANSHVRFGSFELFHYTGRPDRVKELAHHVIDRHFPQFAAEDNKVELLLREVVQRTASLVAAWQGQGFAHGVLNSDNMSILGDTFDFGPFAFIDDYQPGFICNHSDHDGRYAFDQQPSIGLWNCHALAQALSSLIPETNIEAALELYRPTLVRDYSNLMRGKLGLASEKDEDQALVQQLLQLLAAQKHDYSTFFRTLADTQHQDSRSQLRDNFVDREAFDSWFTSYRERISKEDRSGEQRRQAMNSINPKYILRNYLAQQAIDAAVNHDNFAEVDTLLALVQNPFDEHPGMEKYAAPAPQWGKELEISCSS